MPLVEQGHVTTELTVVLKAREGEHIGDLTPFLRAGSTVAVGRSGAVVSSVTAGDKIARAKQLENQVILAEAAMRRGVLLTDKDCQPALRRVIDQVPELYREVADAIKQAALDGGEDEATAEEAAGQAIRVLMIFKQRLEAQLDPAAPAGFMHIDDRVKLISAEPAYLTVVFKLQSLSDAHPLIRLFPYGKKAMGTEAVGHGFSTGNLMEGFA